MRLYCVIPSFLCPAVTYICSFSVASICRSVSIRRTAANGRLSYFSFFLYMPCPFASALGTPNEGFHSSRIHGFALNDILGTLALAGITSYTAKISFMRSVFIWFALAEVLHYAFGVRTAFLERLGIVRDCDSLVLPQIVKEDDSGGS